MAESVSFPRVTGATLLNSTVADLETVLEALLNGLGDGTAEKKVMAALTEIGKKPPEITGAMVSNYDDRQQKIKKYNDEWDSLDTHMSDIAENSAGVSKQTRSAVKELESGIKEIIASVKPNPSVGVQLSAVGAIDKAVEEAGVLVSKAHQAHDANSAKIPTQPGQSSGGQSSGGGGSGFPATPFPSNATPASYNPSDGPAPEIPDGQKPTAKAIYEYLLQKGFSPAQAAGIIGNMQIESGFKTDAYNAGEGAIGLCQWEGGRRTKLEAFAGNKVGDWKTQVDFMVHEMQTSESGAYAQVKAAKTPSQAASAFDRYYERSSGEARGKRISAAENFANSMTTMAV